MGIKLFQDIIDVLRGKKEIKFVERDSLRIPFLLKNKVFRYKSYILCFDYKYARQIIKYNKKIINLLGFYRKRKTYVAQNEKSLQEIYKGQKKFIDEKVMPLVKNTDIICDVGCASGEFTYMFAPKCKYVEGIEYFQKYVDVANNYAKENEINNICFYQGDINNYNFEKKYNHILFMGGLPHILNEKNVILILNKLYNALDKDGYLTIKCDITDNENNLYKIGLNHSVVHYSKQKLIKMMSNQSFGLINEDLIATDKIQLLDSCIINADYWMAVFKKL